MVSVASLKKDEVYAVRVATAKVICAHAVATITAKAIGERNARADNMIEVRAVFEKNEHGKTAVYRVQPEAILGTWAEVEETRVETARKQAEAKAKAEAKEALKQRVANGFVKLFGLKVREPDKDLNMVGNLRVDNYAVSVNEDGWQAVADALDRLDRLEVELYQDTGANGGKVE